MIKQNKFQEENNFQYFLILETALILHLFPKQISNNQFFLKKGE